MSSTVTPQQQELGQAVLTHFGLHADHQGPAMEAMLAEACSQAVRRFARHTLREQPDLAEASDRLLFAREFLKVMVGSSKLLFARAHEELLRINADPASKQQKESLIPVAEHELEPDSHRPGAYYDPLAWRVHILPHATPNERLTRLVLFVDAMLEQEEGVRDAGVSLVDAAKAMAKDGARCDPSKPEELMPAARQGRLNGDAKPQAAKRRRLRELFKVGFRSAFGFHRRHTGP